MAGLTNYQFITNREKQQLHVPWIAVGAFLLILILGLGIYSSVLLMAQKNQQATLDSLARRESMLRRQLQQSYPKGLVATLKPKQNMMTTGFYDYFAFLSSFKIPGIWLTRMNFNLEKQDFFFNGQSLTSSSVQVLLSTLSMHSVFSDKTLKVTQLSSAGALKKKKNTRRRRRNVKKDLPKPQPFIQLYAFSIQNTKKGRGL